VLSIAVINQKGGVAKTTTALNLGAEFARAGKNVLLIDLDAQFSATSAVFGNREFDVTIYDVIVNKVDINKAIYKGLDYGFDMVPSDLMLSAVDLSIASTIGREKILFNQLKHLKYDVIVMDCPPSLGLVTVNALTASREVIVTVCPEYFSLRGINLLEKILTDIEEQMMSQPLRKGVLVTRYRERVVTREAEQAIRKYFTRANSKVFDTVIPENIKIEESHNAHLPIYKYDPGCTGSIAYHNFCKEVMEWLSERI
jgi:chromosome partitioning protein